jgi:hypothetical protein
MPSLQSEPDLAIVGSASVSLLGLPPIDVAGALSISGGSVQTADLEITAGALNSQGTPGTLSIAGLTIGGDGCTSTFESLGITLPTSLSGQLNSTSGPCVAISYQDSQFEAGFSGSFSADGFTAAVQGFLGTQELAFSGTLTAPKLPTDVLGSAPVSGTLGVAGAVYFGSGSGNALPDVTNPATGDVCSPQDGDFYMTTASGVLAAPVQGQSVPAPAPSSGLLVEGIPTNFSLSAGSMSRCGTGGGSEQWVYGSASIGSSSSMDLSVTGSFSDANGSFSACLSGNYTSGPHAPVIDGFSLPNASVTVGYQAANCNLLGSPQSPFTGIDVTATLNYSPGLTATINGDVEEGPSELEYCLYGSASFAVPGVSAGGTAYLYSGNGDLPGSACNNSNNNPATVGAGLTVNAYFSADNGQIVANATGNVNPTDGSFYAFGAGSVTIDGTPLTYSASYCPDTTANCESYGAQSSGFAASITWGPLTFQAGVTQSGDVTATLSLPGAGQSAPSTGLRCLPTGADPSNEDNNNNYPTYGCVSGSISASATLDSDPPGLTFDVDPSVNVSYQVAGNFPVVGFQTLATGSSCLGTGPGCTNVNIEAVTATWVNGAPTNIATPSSINLFDLDLDTLPSFPFTDSGCNNNCLASKILTGLGISGVKFPLTLSVPLPTGW